MQTYVAPVLLVLLFVAYSLPLFLRVFTTTQMVIDEEFHLRQGLYYCQKQFNKVSAKFLKFSVHIYISLALIFLVGSQDNHIPWPVLIRFDLDTFGVL